MNSLRLNLAKCRVILIAAVSRDNIIGVNGKIPWRSKTEFEYFKAITTNQWHIDATSTRSNEMLQFKPATSYLSSSILSPPSMQPIVIMGRRTCESISSDPMQIDKVLTKRKSIIVSSTLKNALKYRTNASTPIITDTITEALFIASKLSKIIFILGGYNIYKECLDKALCNELFISRIQTTVLLPHRKFEKIVTFPDINTSMYERVSTIKYNLTFDIDIYRHPIEYYMIGRKN